MRYILALFLVASLVGSGIAAPIENAVVGAQHRQDGLAKADGASHDDGSLSNANIVQSQAKYTEGDAKPNDVIKKMMETMPVMMGVMFNVTKTFLKDTLPHVLGLALGMNKNDKDDD